MTLTPEQLAAGRRLHGLAIGEESTALGRVEWRIWVDDHGSSLLDMAEHCKKLQDSLGSAEFQARIWRSEAEKAEAEANRWMLRRDEELAARKAAEAELRHAQDLNARLLADSADHRVRREQLEVRDD